MTAHGAMAPPVELFNHKDLSGWHGLIPNLALGWTVKDGAMANVVGANNLVSDQIVLEFQTARGVSRRERQQQRHRPARPL